jgi:hypothetical protein
VVSFYSLLLLTSTNSRRLEQTTQDIEFGAKYDTNFAKFILIIRTVVPAKKQGRKSPGRECRSRYSGFVAQPGLDFLVRLIHLDQAQEERQARLPVVAERVLAGVTGQHLIHITLHKILPLGQRAEHRPPNPTLPDAGQVVHEPEIAAVIEIKDRYVTVLRVVWSYSSVCAQAENLSVRQRPGSRVVCKIRGPGS